MVSVEALCHFKESICDLVPSARYPVLSGWRLDRVVRGLQKIWVTVGLYNKCSEKIIKVRNYMNKNTTFITNFTKNLKTRSGF